MTPLRNPPSMHLRLLLASLFILPAFLGITAWVLDRAFGDYQQQSQRESLRLQQLLLAKAVDWDGFRWQFQGLDYSWTLDCRWDHTRTSSRPFASSWKVAHKRPKRLRKAPEEHQ